jgi:hypothetical protein
MFNAHRYIVTDSLVKPGYLAVTFKRVSDASLPPH